MENDVPTTEGSFLTRRTIVGLGVLAVILIAGIGYALSQGKDTPSSEQTTQAEAQQILAAVGKLMVLPSDEQPVIATIADPSKLAGQAFFAKAKKGDKVLIFNTARKAILYDAVANKIVDVAPLSATPVPTPTK